MATRNKNDLDIARNGKEEDIELHDAIVRIGNEAAFCQKRLLDIEVVPVFDTPTEFARYLQMQRENDRALIQKSGFQLR